MAKAEYSKPTSSDNPGNPGNPGHFTRQMSVEDWRKGLIKFATENKEIFRKAMAEFKGGE